MANFNTIASAPAAAATGNVTVETAFGQAAATSTRTTLAMPSNVANQYLDGREILLRAGILVTTGGSLTFGPSIRLNSGGNTNLTTFTNDTAIVTPTPFTLATLTRLCTITARLSWDASTARLNGSYCFNIDTTYTNWVTLTAGLSAGVTNASSIVWLITGIFGTTQANNTAVLKYFEMDVL